MALVKLTKTELRIQQVRLAQLQRYLPTLQLKKAMLQMEVSHAQVEIENLELEFQNLENKISEYAALFSDRNSFELFSAVKIASVETKHENIAGIDVPSFKEIHFEPDP